MMMMMMMMLMLLNICLQMSDTLPLLLSTLAYYMSSAADVIIQLYVYAALCADVIVDWLLANVLVYVSTCVLHL